MSDTSFFFAVGKRTTIDVKVNWVGGVTKTFQYESTEMGRKRDEALCALAPELFKTLEFSKSFAVYTAALRFQMAMQCIECVSCVYTLLADLALAVNSACDI